MGYLGLEYQYRLLAQVLLDRKFANNILTILKPNYFDQEHLKIITAELINAFSINEVLLDYGSLEFRLMSSINNESQRILIKDTIKKIKESNTNDATNVQDTAIKFCKQQEVKKAIGEIQKIIEGGNLNDYPLCEEKLKKALEVGTPIDDGEDRFQDIYSVLSEDTRKPIPTGIAKLDEVMNGGLSRGELAIVLAALGVGKTTLATKFANTAFNLGLNVIQIFFEDVPKIIKQKHFACWTDIEINELHAREEEVLEIVAEKISNGGGLLLKKFSSIDTNMIKIKNFVKKEIANGFKPDLILLDYIDCVQPTKRSGDNNFDEAMIMREFENLLYEFDIAGWAFTQGNRSAIASEVVNTDQMGGSIKKAQIGHFILSVGRTIDQKEDNKATLAVLKSRFGKDGIIFKNVEFNNGKIHVEISEDVSSKTFLQSRHESDMSGQERIRMLMEQLKKDRLKNENKNE